MSVDTKTTIRTMKWPGKPPAAGARKGLARRLGLLGLLAATLLLARWQDLPPLPQLRNAWFDAISVAGKPEMHRQNPVRIIAIDDESLAVYGRWPWPRDRLAALVEKIAVGRPTVLGVDLLLSERGPGDDGAGDRRLAAAMARTRIVLGSAVVQQGLQSTRGQDAGWIDSTTQAHDPPLHQAAAPGQEGAMMLLTGLPEFKDKAVGQGFLSAWVDGDGKLRSVPVFMQVGDEKVPAFSLEVARVYNRAPVIEEIPDVFGTPETVRFGGAQVPIDIAGRFWPDLRQLSPAPAVSAASILRGEADVTDFQERIVLIGATAIGLDGGWLLPGQGRISGVEAQSIFIQSLLDGTVLQRPWSAVAVEIVGGLLLIALVFALARSGVLRLVGWASVCAAGILTASIVLRLRWGIQTDITWIGLCLLTGFMLVALDRFFDLRRETHRLREFSSHLIDQADDIIFTIDREDRISTANAAAQRLFGSGGDDLIGQPMSAFLATRTSEFQTGGNSATEVLEASTIVPPASRLADLEIRRTPLRGLMPAARLLIGRDITRLRFVERRLDVSNERLQAVLDVVPVGVALFGQDQRLVISNVAFRELVGVSRHDLSPTYESVLAGWKSEQDESEGLSLVGTRLNQPGVSFTDPEPMVHLSGGDGRWLCLHQNSPRAGGLLVAAIDETEIHNRAQLLNDEMERATQAEAAKGILLANVSHELRTPLNAILGFSEIITQDLASVRPERYGEYIEHIHDSAGYLLSLVDDLLEFSVPQESGQSGMKVICDVAAEVTAAVASLKTAAEKAGVTLTSSVPHDPVQVFMTPRHMRQVIVNLGTNGIKFTPSGGTVTIALGLSDGGDAVLMVTDTGVGMTRQELDRTSRRFSRARNGARGETGYGLGLAIVKSIVPVYGLRFEIDAAEDVGTAAKVTIPRALLVAQANPAASA